MTTERARTLRNNMTDSERHLWQHLRSKQLGNCKFRRQQPIGNYFVDFVCLEKKLVVEIDGSQHQEQTVEDEKRTLWLESRGYKIIRFWNNQVLLETEAVLESIFGELTSPPPQPSPVEGEGVK